MRRIVRSARLASDILAGVVVIIGLAGGARAQEIDPKSVLGEWHGQWVLASQRGVSGPFYMTIKKVEDGKVFGRVERPGAPGDAGGLRLRGHAGRQRAELRQRREVRVHHRR